MGQLRLGRDPGMQAIAAATPATEWRACLLYGDGSSVVPRSVGGQQFFPDSEIPHDAGQIHHQSLQSRRHDLGNRPRRLDIRVGVDDSASDGGGS